VGRIAAVMTDPASKGRTLSSHCEVGARLAKRIGLPEAVARGVAHAYERWDGKGHPAGLAGDAIPLATRIAAVARDVDLWNAAAPWDETVRLLRRRRGRSYDPAVVDAFVAAGSHWLEELDAEDPWDLVERAEPDPVVAVAAAQLDDALLAFADFADMKSPWFHGHSRAVSELAAASAAALGLDRGEVNSARRAALVHDLGTVGVPAGVLNRAGRLTVEGWERVRLHPLLTERIVGRCRALADVAADAGSHHERIDGSGYHRGRRDVTVTAELVAAADMFRALGEDRPHRPALAPSEARQLLAEEADSGRFGRETVDAVVTAAGHAATVPNVARPSGLTEREVDVLRLIARGRSNKEVARQLGISTKTVGTHVEHIYAKTNVTTRAGATLFAMEHDLIRL
jgi:HD-GYP domain-containing protein (c-di-GMP phosphodiesterase class II)